MARTGRSPTVGIVGARRRRQGLGFHLARFAAAAGAEVTGIVGTSPGTVAEAVQALEGAGMAPRGFLSVEALLEAMRPDVLFVASPHEAHEAALDLALDAGVHVLCEKPVCWGGARLGERTCRRVEAFTAAGLHLVVNAQWPYTLPTYRALFPDVLRSPPRSFAMRLSPNSRGAAMIPDALPHALSLLMAVLPDPEARIESARIRVYGGAEERLDVTFVYRGAGEEVETRVDLRSAPAQPRVAAYGFDGALARRHVQLKGYRLHLEGDGRRLGLPDPTPQLVQAFLARVSSGLPPTTDPNAWPGMAMLESIQDAWSHAAVLPLSAAADGVL